MAIEKVTLVYVEGALKKVNKALDKCCESGFFHINPPADISGSRIGAKNLKDSGVYEKMMKRCRSLASSLGVTLDENASFDDIDFQASADFRNYLDSVEKKQAQLTEERLGLLSKLRSDNAIYENLLQFQGFEGDFSELFVCKYVKVRFGRLPLDSVPKLKFYSEKMFFFFPFGKEENYIWCLYTTSSIEKKSVDLLFTNLGFERTRLPDFLSGNSDEAAKTLIQQMQKDSDRIKEIDAALKAIADTEGAKLSKVYAKLATVNQTFELRTNVTIYDTRFQFTGYIPANKAESFKEMMSSVGDVSVTLSYAQQDLKAPVKLRNNWLFRPFEMFVKMYGLPAPNGIDPTPIVAITYMFLYGMMFGDLGQGLCIMALGLVLTKLTKAGLAPIITRIGFSSALFGILYGSVFGNEEIIPPFFHVPKIYEFLGYSEPPEDIFKVSSVLLIAALAVGITLILVSMIINMIVSFKMRDLGSALFGASGLFGFIFYASLIAGLVCNLALGIDIMNTAYMVCLIYLPLALMFFKELILEKLTHKDTAKKPSRSSNIDTGLKAALESVREKKGKEKKSVGNFIIEGVIELFETCLTYITNTMSFLRIGGFILSHAGLMLVFSTLAGMFDGVGSVIVLIFGNIFVVGFEGFIVGIQVLRLEFYELFSRFYKGGGSPFKAVSLGRKTKAKAA